VVVLALLVGACAGGGGDWAELCAVGEAEAWALPAEIPEASGLAVSRTHDGLVWTHNDGPAGVLYGLELPPGGGEAHIVARVRVPGPFRDVEDLELARCADGWCLYLADTGDNREVRGHAVVVRVPEPAPGDTAVAREHVWRLELVFPDQPRDVEALVVADDEVILLLSKGRSSPPTWYRVPAAGSTRRTLEVLGSVGQDRPEIAEQITAATAVGNTMVVRSYRSLEVHELGDGAGRGEAAGRGGASAARRVAGPRSIAHLAEPQGEALAVGPDGALLLASEAGPLGGAGGVLRLQCGVDR
jgi:hypothetical protein